MLVRFMTDAIRSSHRCRRSSADRTRPAYLAKSAQPPCILGQDPREQTGVELTAEEILDSPHVFIGSIKDLTRKFTDLRERFGISSFLIDDLDTLAPVVEELAGR